MDRRRSTTCVLLAIGLAAAACGPSVETNADPLETTTTPTTTAPTTTAPTTATSAPDESDVPCGAELPVFVADLEEHDPYDVDGIEGPGPGSIDAEPGQLVRHWIGEYGTYEIRWPARPGVEVESWVDEINSFPVFVAPIEGTRAVAIVEVEPGGQRCSRISAEMYGPRPDPLHDFIWSLVGSLRPRAELDDYLAELDAQRTQAMDPTGRPAGECAEPVAVELNEFDDLRFEVAAEVAGRFMRDRISGARAHDCLTISGLRSYEQSLGTDELCLFECADGSVLVGPVDQDFQHMGESDGTLVLAVVQFDDNGTWREEIEVSAVETENGDTVARITRALGFPLTYVESDRAQQFLAEFLDRLAAGEFEAAAGQLVNEGISEQVENALGDPWGPDSDFVVALEEYCSTALCDVRYEIVGDADSSLFRRGFTVRFEGPDGPVEAPMSVGMFEGQLSLSNLPPRSG